MHWHQLRFKSILRNTIGSLGACLPDKCVYAERSFVEDNSRNTIFIAYLST